MLRISHSRYYLASVIFFLLVCGCVSSKQFSASSEQADVVHSFYEDGKQLLISAKPNSSVILVLARLPDRKKNVQALLFIENTGTRAFDFDPEQITLTLQTRKGNKILSIYPPSEAGKKLTSDLRLVAALNSMAAAYNAGAGIVSDNDEVAVSYATAAASQAANIEEYLLRKDTVFPKELLMGFVYFAFKSGERLIIGIPAENEVHTFRFDLID